MDEAVVCSEIVEIKVFVAISPVTKRILWVRQDVLLAIRAVFLVGLYPLVFGDPYCQWRCSVWSQLYLSIRSWWTDLRALEKDWSAMYSLSRASSTHV